jgi:hypothetical protein
MAANLEGIATQLAKRIVPELWLEQAIVALREVLSSNLQQRRSRGCKR